MPVTVQVLPLQRDHDNAIASLSVKLHAPALEVGRIYRREFDRLAESARIPNFLVILAMNKTRSLLRSKPA